MDMAQKFKIFIDCPEEKVGAGEAAALPLKREPLATKQQLSLRPAANPPLPATSQQQDSSSSSSSNTTSASNSIYDEDQENDISMASLGSDFVPSILNDTFEVEEESEFEEDDEELQLELSQAFQHQDESVLFKSVAYIDDIRSYALSLEKNLEVRPLANYMDYQKEIDASKRAILINWLVEVSDEYQLQAETLFLCIDIIDRFLSKMSIPTDNLQLLGTAAMFIASKYEEIYPPNLYQFVEITDDTYSTKQICQMEQEILKTLNFRISMPTISFFLRQIFAYNKFSKKVFHLAEYLCHLALLQDKPFLAYYPSEIAISAVILAANQLNMAANISSDLKVSYEKSNVEQFRRQQTPFCIEALRSSQERAYKQTLRLPTDTATYNKFSLSQFECVSSIKPPAIQDLSSY